jgi:hypothetical protein
VAELVELVWWLPAALWALVYISDMMLTFRGIALYRSLQGRFVHFDTYELNPFWKATVDRGRRLSLRFCVALGVSTALVAALGWLSSRAGEQGEMPLEFALGALFLLEAAIHLRHARNIFLFRALARGDSGADGLLHYPAALSYRMSAMELTAFAALYALIAVAEVSFFWFGGTLATFVMALRHKALARAALRQRLIGAGAPGG